MSNEELSKRVAELYGILAYRLDDYGYATNEWLHDDSARCFELMVENDLEVSVFSDMVGVQTLNSIASCEVFANYNNDKALATRIAILKCLVMIKE